MKKWYIISFGVRTSPEDYVKADNTLVEFLLVEDIVGEVSKLIRKKQPHDYIALFDVVLLKSNGDKENVSKEVHKRIVDRIHELTIKK